MQSQTYINTMLLTGYSTCARRGKIITDAFTSSDCVWTSDGELEPRPGARFKAFDKALKSIKEKTYPANMDGSVNWLEVQKIAAWERAKEVAPERNYKKRPISVVLSIEYHRELARRMAIPEWPVHFHSMYNTGTAYADPIFKIPDNISDDWLATAVEFLNVVLHAKVDFTNWTIWDRDWIRHRLKMARKLWIDGVDGFALSCKIRDKQLVEAYGRTHAEHMAKLAHDRDWTRVHSPEARADRANSDNLNARKASSEILQDLEKRFGNRLRVTKGVYA